MRRRPILLAIGASLINWPCAMAAQQAKSMPTVAVLTLDIDDRTADLREGLDKLGYADGKNIRLWIPKGGDRYSKLSDIASEFVRSKVDVIVAFGATAVEAAANATSTIPIVMVGGVDPVRAKYAVSLSRPGRNVTGISSLLVELTSKRMELAKEALAGSKRLGILWNPESNSSVASLAQARATAKLLDLQIDVSEARTPGEFETVFRGFAKSGVKIFLLLNSSMFSTNRALLIQTAGRYGLAGIFGSTEWMDHGATLAYGPNRNETYRHAAVYVDKLLKGLKPDQLPIEQPTKFELTINVKSARRVGLEIPRAILVRADKVIE